MRSLLLLLIPVIGLANPIDNKCPQYVTDGAPISKITNGQYLCKANYAIHYRFDTKTPEYVVEHVTLNAITGNTKRNDDFRPDPELSKDRQSTLLDYLNSGYDRGHMASAADNKYSDTTMSDTFYLSNIIPQNPANNRGIWKHLETSVRQWVLDGRDLYVISGTMYGSKYKTIGPDKVGVPTKIWKIVVDAKHHESIAFVLPNADIPVNDLSKYVTTIDEVEKMTGLNFMPSLKSEKIESTTPNLSIWKLK